MVNENSGNDIAQSNGEQTSGIIPIVPGGKQKTLSPEPQSPEASKNSAMGCASTREDDPVPNDSIEPLGSKGGQQQIKTYFKPFDQTAEGARKTDGNQSPKRSNVDDNDENNKKPKSKIFAQGASDDDDDRNLSKTRQSSSATQSSTPLSKLRENFENSDDDDSDHHSWAKRDIAEYRDNYPNVRSNPRVNDNLRFYTNQISSQPDGDYIDNIHKEWFGRYRHLEYHHGYIQWLFPLQEKGLNWSAEPLQKHEIEAIKKDPEALQRILKSYKLMLDFYGFKLVNEKTGELGRLSKDAYKERFRNLNTSSHNYLRITRILKCLGEFEYEYLKFPFLAAVLRECITEDTLRNCLRSCKDYWIETLRSRDERRAIRLYARELIEYRNKGIQPPKSHHAERRTTAPKPERMSISDDEHDHRNQ